MLELDELSAQMHSRLRGDADAPLTPVKSKECVNVPTSEPTLDSSVLMDATRSSTDIAWSTAQVRLARRHFASGTIVKK